LLAIALVTLTVERQNMGSGLGLDEEGVTVEGSFGKGLTVSLDEGKYCSS
jgi:hypothetical protein